MIKRTLYFGNPAYLSTTNEQLVVEFPIPQGTADTIKPQPTKYLYQLELF
jgi:CRISPR-associated protein Cas1